MDISKLENMMDTTVDKIFKEYLTKEKTLARLEQFSTENSTVGLPEAVAFLTNESRNYTNTLVADLIINLAEAGYLNDPDSNS